MTAAQLGRRLGMSPQGVLDLQRREAAESITLATLRKAASALDCDVRVAFVPKRGLDETVRHMAAEMAQEEENRVIRTIGPAAKRGERPDAVLDPAELAALLPAQIRTAGELHQWEAANVARAIEWGYARMRRDVLSVVTLQSLHRRMFGETWKSAGSFRRKDGANSPYHWPQVGVMMLELIDDTRSRYEASRKSPAELDDIAMNFHHRLVQIQPWANGNGRHARLATELLLREWKRPPFTWGHAAGGESGEGRS
jgi:Fic-DOC domain mobile mystery protein B